MASVFMGSETLPRAGGEAERNRRVSGSCGGAYAGPLAAQGWLATMKVCRLPLAGPTPTHTECSMNKDQVKGRINQATGKVKEEVGKAMDDTSTTIKGKAEKAGGKAQATAGDIKNDVKNDMKDDAKKSSR
jgi:uncharacterized protein YjbJ (UPF0337 family)